MRFRDRENSLMWEHYQDSRPVVGFNQQPKTPTVKNALYTPEEEAEVMLEFEPEGPVEVDDSMGLGMETQEEELDEVLHSDIKKLADYSQRLLQVKHGDLDTWMVAKLIKASEYVSDVWHRVDAKADFANTGVDQAEDLSL
jgi:hypothetical protein